MENDWSREELEKKYVNRMKAITIPLNLKFTGVQKILDMSELREVLEQAQVIAQGECECRQRMGNCIDPMDGCFAIDDEAVDWIASKKAKRITIDEALEAMKRTYDAGLVHMAFYLKENGKLTWVCSCCSCCCHSLSASVRFGYSDHVFSSKFIATQDSENCVACGTCVERCQFNARELVDDTLVFLKEKCFGCGVCVETCPGDAIEMIKRS
jgi:NAD-dependent dihydropyrimidine dehydrogenase PreA subunit